MSTQSLKCGVMIGALFKLVTFYQTKANTQTTHVGPEQ